MRRQTEFIRSMYDIALIELFIDYCGIDDECVLVVGNIASLTKLSILGNDRITSVGLSDLASLQHLKYIAIDSRLNEAADLADLKYF